MSDSTEALVERVRSEHQNAVFHRSRQSGENFDAALTELDERVKAAERENEGLKEAVRLGTKAIDQAATLVARAEAAERERDLAHVAIGEHEETYMHMEAFFRAQRDELVEALERIIEEFKAPAEPTGYEEDDPVVIIARAALAKVRKEAE